MIAAGLAVLAAPVARAQCVECGSSFPSALLPPMNGQASDFAPRRAGAEVGADVRIGVASDGIYRVTGGQLAAAGLDLSSLAGSQIRIFCRTQEIAVQVSTPGVLGSNDFVQFYGYSHRGYYTATNVYWLGAGGSGLRMETWDASTNAGGTLVTSHCERVRHAPDLLWRAFYRPDDSSIDHWFAALLTNTGDMAISVAINDPLPLGQPALVAKLHGLTSEAANPDHRTQVKIGAIVITNLLYDGEEMLVATNLFAVGLLTNGANRVSFRQTQTGVSNDRAYLEEFDISYARELKARDGQLTFCGLAGTNLYAVGGFATNTGLEVLDVTDPANALALTNWTATGVPTNYAVNFRAVTDAPRRYHVALTNNIRSAASVQRVFFRDLASTARQADYLAICPYVFREPAYGLLKRRALNGLAVAVAPIEDVYNEFGYGIEDAAAIKQFLGYAFHHWQGPPPRYVCLMGEGSYDPRNNLGLNPARLIPAPHGPTPFSWASQDNWFAAVNGSDNLPDLALGRIPVATADQLGAVKEKTLRFEGTNHFKNATLVADNVDGSLNFKAASQAFIYTNLLMAGYSISRQYLDDTSTSAVRTAIRSNVNGGRHVLSFFGHGAADLWCSENVWNTNDIAGLTNSVFPIVVIFSCQNALFDDPEKECLAEAFVERTNRAAVACVAPSALSVQIYAEQLADGFFDEFTNTSARLGDALDGGLLRLWQYNGNASELLSYEVIGDPALDIH